MLLVANTCIEGGNTKHVSIPNSLDSQFRVTEFDLPWCDGMTYIRTGNHQSYLVAVMGLFAPKSVISQ
jgi:putative transposase